MDIRKWAEKYSTDCRLKYNSEATQENYISQVRSFLYKFKDEVEPKSIPNDKIKEWLLEAKTINTRKHRLCALNSFYSLTVRMPEKISKIPYPKSEKKLPIVLSTDEIQKMFDVCENLLLMSCELMNNLLYLLHEKMRHLFNNISVRENLYWSVG